MTGNRIPYLALFIILIDQATKRCVERWLAPEAQQPLWRGLLTLTHIHNHGVALGWMENTGALVLAASLGAVVWLSLLWITLQAPGRGTPAAFMSGLSCFLGGSAGNTIDRLRLGHVIDFLCLPNGLVVNLADISIALGAVLVCCALWRPETRPAGAPVLVTDSRPLSS